MDIQNIYEIIIDKLYLWVKTFIAMLPNIGVAVLVVVIFFLIGKLIRRTSENLLNRISRHRSINSLLASVAFIAALSVGLFFALSVLELDKAVVSLIAGVGIIGLALGFAFQDLAANFMSGIAIAISEPYKIDQLIETNDHFGTVKGINLRTTDILTPQGQVVMIPNKEIFENPLINYSITNERRIDMPVGISYGDDLEKVKEVVLNAVKNIPGQIDEKEVEVVFTEFGDSSINFDVRFWITFLRQKDYKIAVSDAIMKIKKAFDDNDIMIPFPIRTLDFGIKGGEKLSQMISQKKNGE
jgi:small conductance mechanosensitive channel